MVPNQILPPFYTQTSAAVTPSPGGGQWEHARRGVGGRVEGKGAINSVTEGRGKKVGINLHQRGLSLLCEEEIVEGIMEMDVGEEL